MGWYGYALKKEYFEKQEKKKLAAKKELEGKNDENEDV